MAAFASWVYLATLVVKVSGKLVTPKNTDYISSLAKIIRVLKSEGKQVVVVVGGGGLAREYIHAALVLGANKSYSDIIGIEAARLNARLLIAALGEEAYPEPPRTIFEALTAITTQRIVVCGGFQPGQSTSAVAALLAEALNANKLILATRVNGVYDKDPTRYGDAKLLRRLDYATLRRVLKVSSEPGRYELLDMLAIDIVERSRITVHVVNGSNPENILRAARNEEVGSIITIDDF